MALIKQIVSARTGVTLGYHEVAQVSFRVGKVEILVASYPDKAAKDAGKAFTEIAPEVIDHDGSAISKAVFAFAEDKLLTTDKFTGATQS